MVVDQQQTSRVYYQTRRETPLVHKGLILGVAVSGPFQPSHEMMLMFYAYFKQATEGPCHITKPNFWEIVKKAKW